MRRVAVGVEDRCQIVRDVVRNLEGVEGWNHQVLGEGALAVDADPKSVAAQMTAAGAAIAAKPAGNMAFAGDPAAYLKAAHFLPHLDNFSNVFVSDLHRDRKNFLRPLIPFPDMN